MHLASGILILPRILTTAKSQFPHLLPSQRKKNFLAPRTSSTALDLLGAKEWESSGKLNTTFGRASWSTLQLF